MKLQSVLDKNNIQKINIADLLAEYTNGIKS